MLRVKSFDIKDDKGINELLEKHQLAPGMHILVSEGNICVPYDDGKVLNKEQKVSRLNEEKNAMQDKIDLMVHSQRVLEIQEAGVEKQITECEAALITAPKGKDDYEQNKENEAKIKQLKNVLDQTRNQILMNQAELTRLLTNIQVYDERIEAIK